jgi:hypothetical protein
MDINIQDEYYNKYLKYKLKYLELKQSGGGLRGFNSWKNTKLYGNNYHILENILKDKNKLLSGKDKKLSDDVFIEI